MGLLSIISRRQFNFMALLVCGGLLGFGYYLQFYRGLEPCPLCIFQRLVFIALAVVFLVAALHDAKAWGKRVYAFAMLVIGLVGVAISSRHLWLQNLPPDQLPDCGPGLDYMLEVFPLTETLKMAFTGSGECAEVSWSFLGLSMPAWALVFYLLLAGLGLIKNLSK